MPKRSLNKNPGKNAKKNIETFGFNTFIKKPCLKSCVMVFLGVTSSDNSILVSVLYTLNARYKRYTEPNILIPKYKFSEVLIIAETPKANKVVCTKQPEIKPITVANPKVRPFTILCVKTKILSGPGEIAKIEVANAKDKSVSIIIVKIHIFAMS